MPRRSRSPPPPAPSRARPACAGLPGASCSCRTSLVVSNLSGVEGFLEQRDHVFLGERLVVAQYGALLRLAGLQHDGELSPCHRVERLAQQTDVLRLCDLSAMEVGAGGELEREGVAGEDGRRGFRKEARNRDGSLTHCLDHAALPRVGDLLQHNRRRLRLLRLCYGGMRCRFGGVLWRAFLRTFFPG